MKMLSERQAYAAMFAFLSYHYRINNSHDIALLLSGMAMLPSGDTADPAMWHEWLEAVGKARAGEVDLDQELK
jgi:hypothetical protein